MATGVQPSKFINYISQFKKVLVTRNNGVITQTFKIDSSIDDNYYFSIVNSNNQLISLEGRVFRIYGSLIDTKQQMHILFYSDKCTIENGTQMHFKIETYTSQYMNWVKSKRIIDLTIVEVANPDAPEEEQTTQVVLRDEAIAYKRPYIENQTPTEILQKVILTTNVPLTGAFGSGHDIDLTIGSDGAAFGTGLKQTGDNQLVIGQYNEADATKAFVIGNGEDNSNRSNAFTVDYQGNVEAKSITVDGQDVGDKVNQLESDIEAVSAAIPSVEGFATEQWVQDQGYLTAHQDLTAYATKDWVEGKGYITGVNLDPYATKDQLTAYATKTDLTVSASVLSNQISQLALNIPTKVSDLTNDAGYLTAVPTSYALKTDIPTGNAQLQNTAGYITGYNAGTGISISNGTISLTGEVGKTYYADNNTLQLNNTTNTFSIKSLSSKLNQGQNILLTPQSDGSVTINAIGGGGGGTGGATYLAGLGLGLSTVSAEDAIYKFYVNEPWLDNKINTATSGIQNLSAGTGLEIEDNVISLTAEIPSIDGLASEEWVETNFLSAIPSNYATKDYVDSSVSGKADLSSVYTKEEVYTYIETDAKINEATSGKADKSAVQAVDDKFANYYTSAQVDQAIASAVEDIPSTVYTGEDGIKVDNGVISLTATLSSITNDAGFITSADIPTSYVQQSELETVSGQLTNAIGAKANTTDVEAEFTATSAWANETFLTEHQSLSSYYTKSEVDSAIGTATNDMATQTWVEEQGYLTAHQSLDDYYNKTEVDTISSNIVSQIPTDVATSAYVQAASGNAVSVATGWVDDQNYLTEVPSEYITETELATELEPYAQSADVTTAITNATSGKADQSTVESLSTALSTAIDTKANSADVYTKTEVYTKGETDTAINTSTSGKVNKTDFDTVTGALSSAIDTKVTSAQVKDQVEAYGYITGYTAGTNISISNQNVISLTGTTPIFVNYQGQDCVVDKMVFDEIFDRGVYYHDGTSGVLEVNFVPTVNVSYSELDEPLRAEQLTFSDDFSIEYYEGGDYYDFQISINSDILSGCATKTELQTASGTLSTAISGVSDRVGAIEADYTTSAYVTGQVNNLATGAVATNTANISQLSTSVNTISTTYATTNYVNTVSTNLSTELTGWVTENTLTGYTAGSGLEITENNVIQLTVSVIPSAVSQLVNDSNFITYADIVDGVEYHAGEGLSLINNTFALTGTVLSGDGSTIAINNNVISVIGGGSGGKTYTGGTGIEVDNTNDTISLTATIPTAISDLTNDSSFATSAQVSSIVTGYNYITGITVSYTDEEYNSYTVSGTGIDFGQGFVEVSDYGDNIAHVQWKGLRIWDESTDETVYIKQIDFSLTDFNVRFSEDYIYVSLANPIPLSTSQLTNDSGFITAIPTTYVQKSEISDMATQTWVGQQGYLTDIPTSYALKTDVETAISSSSGAIVDAATGAITVPTKTSDLTNDSGFATSAQVSAIASAYAQGGGGGGTTYTAGTGIDITSDVISVDQTWFEGAVSSLVSGDMDAAASAAVESYIELSGLATGTGLYYDDTDNSLNINLSADANSNMVVSADNNGVVWLSSMGGGSTYTAGDYISLENDTIAVTGLPSQIDYISSVVSAIPTGAEQTNQKTISTGFTYDSKLEIAKNTYTPTDGVITLSAFEVPAGSLDSDKVATFEEWVNAKGTLTGFVFDGVTLTNELPSNISQTKCYVFTRRILGNGEQYISFNYEGINQLYVPLTFKGKGATNAVRLTQNGSPDAINLSYSKNGGEWTTYNIGDTITLNQNQTIAFSGSNNYFSKNMSNYYQFAMTGTIEAKGNIQSLMNFSNSCANWCYFSMFQNCSSLTTPPQLPATTLAEGCYYNMFFYCSNLISAPQLPVTTLAEFCYYGMFYLCMKLTSAPSILPATTLERSCYSNMFQGCSKLSSININFTTWSSDTSSWVGGIAANGTFTCPTALGTNQTISRGIDRCPTNWTVVNK